MLSKETDKNGWVSKIISERNNSMRILLEFDFIEKVFPSDSNFLLVKMKEPRKVYQYLVDRKLIVRDRSKVSLCEGCLRVTVGSQIENEKLVKLLNRYSTNA
jgi:histidinol-phosphate aminotransferase